MNLRYAARALLCCALAACGSPEPVTDADKALFLRVGDLAEFGVRYPNAEAAETFSKAKQSDGSHEITYKFETSGDMRSLFIHGDVNVGRASSDAALAEGAEKIGLLAAFRKSGIEEREVPGIRAGKLVLLVKAGVPIGNVFTFRDSSRMHLFFISGLYVGDAAIWHKLMEPKLERLMRYSPETKS